VNEWKRKEAFAYMNNLDSMLRVAQREQDERATRSANSSREKDGKLKRTDEEERRLTLREGLPLPRVACLTQASFRELCGRWQGFLLPLYCTIYF
jgi:hypothetical protein